jgi:hypothetical protein
LAPTRRGSVGKTTTTVHLGDVPTDEGLLLVDVDSNPDHADAPTTASEFELVLLDPPPSDRSLVDPDHRGGR